MSHARNLSLAFAGAALFASLPAAADTAPAAPTPIIITTPGPVPLPQQPAAPPPAAYPPGAYPAPYPGAYPPPAYYAPPPGGYYAPPGGYYAPRYQALPLTERQSVGAMAGGSVALGVGGILVFAALFVAVTPTCSVDSDGFSTNCDDHSATVVGLTVAGLAAIAVGIPLVIYGSRRVRIAATASSTSPLPAFVGAPGGTGWRWSF